jgi:hypothetical protein
VGFKFEAHKISHHYDQQKSFHNCIPFTWPFLLQKEEVGDEMLQLTNAFIGAAALDLVVDDNNVNLPVDQAISLVFSAAINTESANESISLSSAMGAVEVNLTFSSGDKSVAIFPKWSAGK